LHCGSENTGKWIEEKVNVYEDFECIFGVSPPEIEGIAILSDSDNTQSSVEADYDDFRLSVIK
jgi:hypothetical protein